MSRYVEHPSQGLRFHSATGAVEYYDGAVASWRDGWGPYATVAQLGARATAQRAKCQAGRGFAPVAP